MEMGLFNGPEELLGVNPMFFVDTGIAIFLIYDLRRDFWRDLILWMNEVQRRGMAKLLNVTSGGHIILWLLC